MLVFIISDIQFTNSNNIIIIVGTSVGEPELGAGAGNRN